jgi:hypothetical protein
VTVRNQWTGVDAPAISKQILKKLIETALKQNTWSNQSSQMPGYWLILMQLMFIDIVDPTAKKEKYRQRQNSAVE